MSIFRVTHTHKHRERHAYVVRSKDAQLHLSDIWFCGLLRLRPLLLLVPILPRQSRLQLHRQRHQSRIPLSHVSPFSYKSMRTKRKPTNAQTKLNRELQTEEKKRWQPKIMQKYATRDREQIENVALNRSKTKWIKSTSSWAQILASLNVYCRLIKSSVVALHLDVQMLQIVLVRSLFRNHSRVFLFSCWSRVWEYMYRDLSVFGPSDHTGLTLTGCQCFRDFVHSLQFLEH